jgi:putative nucleotidyltransferase with HDIG domain
MSENPVFGRQNDLVRTTARNLSRGTLNYPDRGQFLPEDPFKVLEDLRAELAVAEKEKRQLKSLADFSIKLFSVIDKDIAVQQAATCLQMTLGCGLVAIFRHKVEDERLEILYATGPECGRIREKLGERWERYWHSLSGGVIGQAIRTAHVQISNEPDRTLELFHGVNRPFYSIVTVPLFANGFLEGVILLADTESQFFDRGDVTFIKSVHDHMIAAWERISYAEREKELIKSAAGLVEINSPTEVIKQLAQMTCDITDARMTVIGVYEDPEWTFEMAGHVDARLVKDTIGLSAFFREISSHGGAWRMRDLHRDPRSENLDIEDSSLRSLLVCPFYLSDMVGAQAGLILALGKQSGVAFTEADQSLIELLANHAALALDHSITRKELRDNLESIQHVHGLSLEIARSLELKTAARAIVSDALHLTYAFSAGISLSDENGDTIIQLSLPDGLENDDPEYSPAAPPAAQIAETTQTGSTTSITTGETIKKVYPIKTQERCYGALWLELPIRGQRKSNREDEIKSLINQTAVALESSIRNAKVNRAYQELTEAHEKLEKSHNELSETFEQTIQSLMRALDAREHETAGHSDHVVKLALFIGRDLNLDHQQMHDLKYAALLHDIGKIGMPDDILLKPGGLTDGEREIMQRHSIVGSNMVRDIPNLQGAADIIANHHELWNGSGYPRGLAERFIPQLARIVTVADVFDALCSDRPYRDKLSPSKALAYLQEKAGILYDPQIVEILIRVLPEYLEMEVPSTLAA